MGLVNDIKVLTGNKEVIEKPEPKEPGRVMVVEDELSLANLLELELKDNGFIVEKAENGQVALEKLPTFKPNLIILDLLMPVMDGKVMLHEMRKIPEFKKTPVLVLTNQGNVDNMRETQLYEDASEFLIKANVGPADIVNKVKTYFGGL